MNDTPGLPPEVITLVTQLSNVNRTLADYAQHMCGRSLTVSEDRNLDSLLTIRQSLINRLDLLGYKVECGPNVYRNRAGSRLEAALGLLLG